MPQYILLGIYFCTQLDLKYIIKSVYDIHFQAIGGDVDYWNETIELGICINMNVLNYLGFELILIPYLVDFLSLMLETSNYSYLCSNRSTFFPSEEYNLKRYSQWWTNEVAMYTLHRLPVILL